MSQMDEPPESFPVNALVPIPGTPLGDNEVRLLKLKVLVRPTNNSSNNLQRVSIQDMLRTVATARIVLPT